MLSFTALHKIQFDNVARLCQSRIIYTSQPTLHFISLFQRVGLSTDTTIELTATIIHDVDVPWFVIRGQVYSQYVTQIKTIYITQHLNTGCHLLRNFYEMIQTVVQYYQVHVQLYPTLKHFLILVLLSLHRHHKNAIVFSLDLILIKTWPIVFV